PGVVIDEHAKEALDGAEQRPMDHEGLLARAIFGDIFQSEALGQSEIKLYGRKLPGTANGIHQLHIDLRAVKNGFAWHRLVRNTAALKRLAQRSNGELPIGVGSGVGLAVFYVPDRKFGIVLAETKGSEHCRGKVEEGGDVGLSLPGSAED